MHHRSRWLPSVAAVVVSAGVWLMPVAVEAQASGAAQDEESYTVPRTADGHPDLQGFWTNQTYTPLERPEGVDKAFYTVEEVAAIESGRASREAELTVPGTIPDVHYDFTQFGLDRSQSPFARNLRTSLIVDPPDGRMPPVNAEGRRRAAEAAAERERVGRWDSAEANQLDDRCIIMRGAGPPMMNAGYNANYQIVQNRDYVMILVEMIHDARIIPLDGRAHLPDRIRQWLGDPRARWEGDTLVVESTNFSPQTEQRPNFFGIYFPVFSTGEHLHFVERFTRVDADTIDYRFTVTDPTVDTRPWTAAIPMTRTGSPLFEYACHEGNYAMTNGLSGTRAEQAATGR